MQFALRGYFGTFRRFSDNRRASCDDYRFRMPPFTSNVAPVT